MFKRIYEFGFRVYRVIGRTIIRYSHNPRPSSYPYVTGDGFRSIADHIYDSTPSNFDPTKVKEKDIVFVGNDNIKIFLRNIHPHIHARYILVTHNSDESVNAEVAALLDDRIIKCYSYNVSVEHPKIVPIPVGIENKHWYVQGIPFFLARAARKIAKHPDRKKDKIFYRFTLSINAAERKPALDALLANPCAETTSLWLIPPDYLTLISTYKFTVSPYGSSEERHTTWDAYYLGVIPIVKRSVLASYMKKCGLPLWIIDDWRELASVDQETLRAKYNEIMLNVNKKALFMDYWIDKIRNMRD